MLCAKCGEEMRMTEKDTSSGRDIREYKCDGCGHSDWEDNGTALWQVLSDYREADEAERMAAGAPTAEPGLREPERVPTGSLWERLRALLGKER